MIPLICGILKKGKLTFKKRENKVNILTNSILILNLKKRLNEAKLGTAIVHKQNHYERNTTND